MRKNRLAHRTKILCGLMSLVTLLLLVSIVPGTMEAGQSGGEARSDVIVIDALSIFGMLERPAVMFPHDMHTQALGSDKTNCETCHMTGGSGDLVYKFKRLVNDDHDSVMDIYHDGCITCHKERADSVGKWLPVTCGDCHKHEPDYRPSLMPAGFDNSLHYRHIAAVGDQCQTCHHGFEQGMESSCRGCHLDRTIGNKRSMRLVSHKQCIACHLDAVSAVVDCADCHDAERLKAVGIIENIPRLRVGQPDFVILSAAAYERQNSKLSTVPFSHIGHESFTDKCRNCHHESMKSCTECHALQAADASSGVTLQRAMHDLSSTHSCVGCHESKKSGERCSGCHSLMIQRRLPERTCALCHKGPAPENLEAVRAQYTSLDDFRPPKSATALSFAAADIPEEVEIGMLSKQYESVRMPHRRHIDSLMSDIRNSKLATFIHGHEDAVCQGCHHHSPVGSRPPLCESCHGDAFKEDDPHRPGLKGAYHRQCIGCHESMNIEKPSACTDCHAEKIRLGSTETTETDR